MVHRIFRAFLAAGLAAGSWLHAAGPALAQSLGQMASQAAGDLGTVPNLVEIIFYVAGILLIGLGIVRFRKLSEGGGSFVSCLGPLLVGAALVLMPAVFNALVDTFGAPTSESVSRPRLQ